jgi:P27 family predicted phage terminase small subunit
MNSLKTLKRKGREFYNKVITEYEFSDAHDLERLLMACKTLDNIEDAEKQLKADGLYITNRYGNVTEHPAMRTIKDLRLLFIKIIRELGMDIPAQDSRPPGRY